MQITSSPRDTENKIGIIFCEKVYAFGSEANLYARGRVYKQGNFPIKGEEDCVVD